MQHKILQPLAILACFAISGCVQNSAPQNHNIQHKSQMLQPPEHLGSFTISCQNKQSHNLHDFGGISGISYYKGDFYMSTEALPYVYKVSLDTHATHPDFKILKKIKVSGAPDRNMTKLEAMAVCQDRIILGSEGIPKDDMQDGNRDQDVFLFMTDMEGHYIQDIPIPNPFLLSEGKGAPPYRGIQGLSCAPGGETLLVSFQKPLKQDTAPGIAPTSRNLLLQWDSQNQTFNLTKSFHVNLNHNLGIMGSELINDSGTAVILESADPITNALYVVDTDSGEDISDCESLLVKDSDYSESDTVSDREGCSTKKSADKQLLVETVERYSGQDAVVHEVQYDALGTGPKLQDGRYTLLLATDDDHCGSISNSMATTGLNFSGTTFSIFAVSLPE